MALYVLGYWVGIHFYGMVHQFNCIFCIQSNLELTFLHVAAFVKIPFQHINYPNMLRMCRPDFMKIQGPVTYFSNLMKTHDLNSSKCKKYNNSSNGRHYGVIFFKPEKNLEFFRLKNDPIDAYPGKLE